MSEHQHKWVGRLFSDGCHFYSNQYECECGDQLVIYGERVFFLRGKMQPGVYMADETGSCDRCRELMAGKRRKPTTRLLREAGVWYRWLKDGRKVVMDR